MDVDGDLLSFRCEGFVHLNVTIFQGSGRVRIAPEANWSGLENLKFYASDGNFEISGNVAIKVIPINDPPGPAEILKPIKGVNVSINDKIEFLGRCDDPDLAYGDILSFIWSSDRDGEIGSDINLLAVTLSEGKHNITFSVIDRAGLSSSDNVEITVIDSSDNSEVGDCSIFYILIVGIGVFIAILIAILSIIRIKNKSNKKRGIGTHKIACSDSVSESITTEKEDLESDETVETDRSRTFAQEYIPPGYMEITPGLDLTVPESPETISDDQDQNVDFLNIQKSPSEKADEIDENLEE
jgi:hypothetical protein